MNAGKPMSDAGCVYFFACDMLYAAALAYYSFNDDKTLDMSQIGHRPWNSIAEDIMGWTIEEVAFCLNREKVPPDQARNVGSFAETTDSEIFQRINSKVVESAARFHQMYSDIAVERYVYACYCRFLFRVLVEFRMIMDDKRLRQARYFENYQRDIALFNGLSKELEKEFAGDSKIPSAVTSGIEATAVALSAIWRQAVFSAAAHVFAGHHT